MEREEIEIDESHNKESNIKNKIGRSSRMIKPIKNFNL